jgi:SAM-dependent methyltransferase
MAGVDSVVATRYHNIVCALRLGKPTVALNYAAKGDVLMAEMGVAEFCHPARSADLQRLIAQFTEAENRREELRRTITDRTLQAADRLQRQATALSAGFFDRTRPVPPPHPTTKASRMTSSLKSRLWKLSADSFRVFQRTVGSLGFRQSESRIAADAQAYWSATPTEGSKARSHWRDAHSFADNQLWQRIGKKHLEMYHRAARTVGHSGPAGRILEWGCGGGANAVHFAPVASEFIGVEISQDSLDECAKQLANTTSTPFRQILVDVDRPEEAITQVDGPVDLFLCVYVFELIPTPEYGARLLRIASSVLASDGIGIIQIRYSTDSWWTKPRRRHYRSGMTDMTTYSIDEFWQLIEACGLRPVNVELAPNDDLDERYAYFTVTRPTN